MASDISVRSARVGESQSLTALCVRSKAHWGYDEAFMRLSQASLTVSEAEIVERRVLVAERQGLVFGVARVEPDGELGLLFVDPLALNRGPELKLHVNGALNNGLTKEEIKEIFLQVAIYCGIPASLDAFKTASGVFKERGI